MKDRSLVERLLTAAVQAVLPPVAARPLIAVEATSDVDACSAYESLLVVSALGRRHVPWRFLWIPTRTGQVGSVARLMAAYNAELLADVEFVHRSEVGDGPAPLEALAPIDFAWIRGLRSSLNLETLLGHLSDGGIALVENPPAELELESSTSASNGGRNADLREIRYAVVTVDGGRWLLAGAATPVEKILANAQKLDLQVVGSGIALVPSVGETVGHDASSTWTLNADALNLATGWSAARRAFPLITIEDFARAVAAGQLIEERIVGRHCGDLGDRLAQYLAIVQYVRATDSRIVNVLEIGTLFGGSCLMNLSAMRDLGIDGKVTCIDPLAGYYSESADPKTGLPVDRDTLYLNLARCGFTADRIELRQCVSSAPEARAGLAPGSFAMLMIDGDHSADGIRDDWNAFVDYLAPDGTVLIDDYADPVWPDITVVADQLSTSKGWTPVATLGTTLMVRRDGSNACMDSSREPTRDVPTIGVIARALTEDTRATTHWSARLSSALVHLRHWIEMDRQLELGRTAMARKQWPVAEAHLAGVVSRPDATPAVLLRAWLCLADCAEQRLNRRRVLECLERAVDLEQKLVAHGHPHLYASNRLRRALAEAPLDRLSA